METPTILKKERMFRRTRDIEDSLGEQPQPRNRRMQKIEDDDIRRNDDKVNHNESFDDVEINRDDEHNDDDEHDDEHKHDDNDDDAYDDEDEGRGLLVTTPSSDRHYNHRLRLEIGNEEDDSEHQSTPAQEDWRKAIRNWTLFYGIVLAVLILILNSANGITMLMRDLSGIMAAKVCGSLIRNPAKAKSIGTIYGLSLSLLLLWRPIQSDLYAGSLHLPTLPDLKYIERYRPFQALGLGNGYARQLGEALQTHFERYSRNETQRFEYVETLNLIGNLFDDRGADFIIDTLYHNYSYTSRLLLGRNQNLGDSSAIRLANLISSSAAKKKDNSTSDGKTDQEEISQAPIGQPLVWLEYGGTSVTETGLQKLYEAIGTRSFEFLELEYTDNIWPRWYRPNPIPASVRYLHKAKYLQEIDFTGNCLSDNDMSILVGEVLQTNISSVNLMNNKIGTRGVIDLLPLTKTMKRLDLAMNWRIGDQGAIALAKALNNTNNTTVETLTLFKCRVGQKGAEAFLSIFPRNQQLKYLSLTVNDDDGGIDKATIQALRKATDANW
ncbi:RNI-like protein [Fragilariopsis cylindrus CCMP1102]|uniref:RNI-like protein n=1 Tax=Fragilariopsis cylindrus CCMP1102 TaxID=635003 RepID=A0A1E7FCK6_9STRA|nr:RNI-like protein [Fragilariopsis cylindrus CCMP1102]|eukprot:OEU15908.1 RNI-like protein [Fragilariopsis cylindrus CCMP1102]